MTTHHYIFEKMGIKPDLVLFNGDDMLAFIKNDKKNSITDYTIKGIKKIFNDLGLVSKPKIFQHAA
jgi:hypothetical protein